MKWKLRRKFSCSLLLSFNIKIGFFIRVFGRLVVFFFIKLLGYLIGNCIVL